MISCECLNVVENQGLDITPVLDKDGTILWWSVGKRCVDVKTGRNFTVNTVEGSSICEGVYNFMSKYPLCRSD